MFATYWHRRYGGDPNQLLRPGDIGGHVMTIVPGTYNPKTGMIGVVDQRGFQMRSIRDMDLRQAAAPTTNAPVAARIGGGVPFLLPGMPGMAALGGRIDSATIDGAALDRAATQKAEVEGSGSIDVDFKNMPNGVSGNARGEGLFKKTTIARQTQMVASKGAAPSALASSDTEE